MWRAKAGFLVVLVLTAGVCLGQQPQQASPPAHYIRIDIPRAVNSESVFIRYILAGEELGGWVQAHAGVSSYIIGTTREGQSATGIKAVLYAPGCEIQTLDLPLSNSNNPEYSFICRPLGSVWIAGKMIQIERLSGHDVKLQAQYIGRWAQSFLGLPVGIPLTIPVGEEAYPAADNSFQISVPDLWRDPIAGAPDHPGELQIWARDRDTGDDISQLNPAGAPAFKTRMGGLKIQKEYPPDTVFAPCALRRPPCCSIAKDSPSGRSANRAIVRARPIS